MDKITTSITEETKHRLKILSAETGLNMNSIVERLVNKECDLVLGPRLDKLLSLSESELQEMTAAYEAVLMEFKRGLSERDRVIYYSRIQGDVTLQELGDIYGITKERVRQIEVKLFEKAENLKEVMP